MDLDWTMIFNGWGPIVRTCILGTLAYLAVVFLLRVSGKRTLSKMNAFDFVVTIALGSTLASILTSDSVALSQGIVALALLILLQWINTFLSVRWRSFQKILKAQPTLLVYQGEFLQDSMKQQRVTEVEILAAAREQGISHPRQIEAAILETEGSLSIVRRSEQSDTDLAAMGLELPS